MLPTVSSRTVWSEPCEMYGGYIIECQENHVAVLGGQCPFATACRRLPVLLTPTVTRAHARGCLTIGTVVPCRMDCAATAAMTRCLPEPGAPATAHRRRWGTTPGCVRRTAAAGSPGNPQMMRETTQRVESVCMNTSQSARNCGGTGCGPGCERAR